MTYPQSRPRCHIGRALLALALIGLIYSRPPSHWQTFATLILVAFAAFGLRLPVRVWLHRAYQWWAAMPIRRKTCYAGFVGVAIAIGPVTIWPQVPQPMRHGLHHVAYKCLGAILELQRDWRYIHPDAIRESGLPIVNIKLSDDDVSHFAALYRRYQGHDGRFDLPFYQANNKWRHASMEFEGTRYRVKIRAHAQQPDGHQYKRWISFAVRLRDPGHVFHVRRFNLIVYWRIRDKAHHNQVIADVFGIQNQRDRLVAVKINDWDEALYYLEFPQTRESNEAGGQPPWIRLDDDDYKSLVIAGSRDRADDTALYEIRKRLPAALSQLEAPTHVKAAVAERYVALNRRIIEQDNVDLEAMFDPDYLASFEAARLLGGFLGHGAVNGNFVLFYDTASGRFFPAFHRDWFVRELRQRPILEAHPFENLHFPFATLIRRHDRIRQASYRKIWSVVSTEATLLDICERYVYRWPFAGDRMLPGWLRRAQHEPNQSEHSQNAAGAERAQDTTLFKNATLLRAYLGESHPSVVADFRRASFVLAVRPGSMSGLQIQSIDVTGIAPQTENCELGIAASDEGTSRFLGRYHGRWRPISAADGDLTFRLSMNVDAEAPLPVMCDGLDEALNRSRRLYYVMVDGDTLPRHGASMPRVTVTFINTVTGDQLSCVATAGRHDSRVIKSCVSQAAQQPVHDAVERLIRSRMDISLQRLEWNQLLLPAGEYVLQQDVVLPPNTDLIIDSGVTLRLEAGVSLVGYGSLTIRGTRERPVVIEPVDSGRPFGSVAMIGHKRTRCDIRFLRLVGGSEAVVDGAHLSGAMSLYYHDQVSICDSSFSSNHADDGVNIKSAHVIVDRCTFRDNDSDQLDLDICDGQISDSEFTVSAAGHGQDGDGVDLSMSSIILVNCRLSGLRDKGVSVGEQSRVLIRDCRIEGCTMGVAVKDSSHGYLWGTTLSSNTMDVCAYRKKVLWDSGTVSCIDLSNWTMTPRLFGDPGAMFFDRRSVPARRMLGDGDDLFRLLEESPKRRVTFTEQAFSS